MKTSITDYLIAKRAFDLLFSLFIIVFVLSWLLPVLFLVIWFDSRGPVFFIQKRVGKNGKMFRCLKLRTMVINPDADIRQATVGDPRITRVGRFLRNSSLDELPQFFNVLAGSMSVVGPRPHMLADDLRFAELIKGYGERSIMKPGITGMAQVKGYKGPAPDFTSIFHRYQWDAFYVRNAHMMLDLRIVIDTFMDMMKVMFTREKTVQQPSAIPMVRVLKAEPRMGIVNN
jgi:putative colanic acid biosynthesis UDP-glucose lipid carrier transferase